ncbi:PA3496 family putative envelope integrity protein [Halioxenophilus sp. WMMB6]|uniref:PA3496 family putative envelope integrity protein n=1 Tax=Halioxenophilus sp. WMMB6 TaxID=3073815 RepID=UPI00295F4F17|nr:hypothetical protein [Halioxenophilus sp. WMMB6]
MRDELTNDAIDADLLINGLDEDVDAFTKKNQQLDSRRRLEEALEERRLSREIQEFDFDFDELDD